MNFIDPKELDVPNHGTKNRYKTILPSEYLQRHAPICPTQAGRGGSKVIPAPPLHLNIVPPGGTFSFSRYVTPFSGGHSCFSEVDFVRQEFCLTCFKEDFLLNLVIKCFPVRRN